MAQLSSIPPCPYPELAGLKIMYDINTDSDIVGCLLKYKGPQFLEGLIEGKLVLKRTEAYRREYDPRHVDRLITQIKTSISQRMEVKIPCAGYDYLMVYKFEEAIWPRQGIQQRDGMMKMAEDLTLVYQFGYFEELRFTDQSGILEGDKDSIIAKARAEQARRMQVEKGKNILLDILHKKNV